MVEAILAKDCSIHCQNHRERSGNLAKLASFPTNAYKALERQAHDSRYKKHNVYDWEIHIFFKDHFQKMVRWFNSQAEGTHALNIHPCKESDDEWLKRYKDAGCNSCH